MPEITKGPVHLFYEDAGAGPAVLFSHSWFCDGRQWPQTETLISAGYRTLNLDNRGHAVPVSTETTSACGTWQMTSWRCSTPRESTRLSWSACPSEGSPRCERR
jgi:hypothetical protein